MYGECLHTNAAVVRHDVLVFHKVPHHVRDSSIWWCPACLWWLNMPGRIVCGQLIWPSSAHSRALVTQTLEKIVPPHFFSSKKSWSCIVIIKQTAISKARAENFFLTHVTKELHSIFLRFISCACKQFLNLRWALPHHEDLMHFYLTDWSFK